MMMQITLSSNVRVIIASRGNSALDFDAVEHVDVPA